ncbi:hypothetical protein GE061_011098 [Apolygus lucorum]|uniref:Dynein axonemal intermediate chain 4 n=1 Tax=Apolygus lucorum TaxID=248454 RepID=A0A8S9XXW4_APOLU|nr:hypothetical protein GE061_011098 [Apolygus lucorum]
MKMLENKRQQRLIEEHRQSFRSFKYAGPSREGALFCLREKYRRERKAWRVKYAKKYGLLCRQVRLEKRLMRKARRLLTRERILNALREKTRSKLLVLIEMRHEFKKLVDKLKLNKEIQEKIKRQDRMSNKSLEKRSEDKHPEREPSVTQKQRTRRAFSATRSNPKLIENLEVQKSPAQLGKHVSNNASSMNALKLTPLPSIPSTSSVSSDYKLPPINQKTDRAVPKAPRTSKTDMRCPPLVQDKKLGAGLSQTGSASSSSKVGFYASTSQNQLSKVPKARMAESVHRELPLINEGKYGASPYEMDFSVPDQSFSEPGSMDRFTMYSDSQLRDLTAKQRIQALIKKEHDLEYNLQTGRSLAKERCSMKGGLHQPEQEKLFNQWFNRTYDPREKAKMIKASRKSITENIPDIPKMSTRTLKGKLVRKSDIDRIPRYKYKPEDTKSFLHFFTAVYRKLLEDDLKNIFGTKPESFMEQITYDVKNMAEFVFDHIHMLPVEEIEEVINDLLKFREDPRFETFKRLCLGYNARFHSSANTGILRYALKYTADKAKEDLAQKYKEYKIEQQKKRKDQKADKTLRGRAKKTNSESRIFKKRRRKTLADKLLLQRGQQFNNPVRVTTKLGGKLMLQGWKTLPFEEYSTLGPRLDVFKSGWRKDGMESYEVITPPMPVDDLKYLLILNRLDLTPRRFSYPGYKYNGYIVHLFKYCSTFYRSCMLRRGEWKIDRDKRGHSIQDSHSRARVFFGTGLLQGEFRVPHLRHKIFTSLPNATQTAKPKDRNTPMIFSKRNDVLNEDPNPKKLRILLQETETLDLYTFESIVALRGTEEARKYSKDARRMNKYDSVFHRCFEREVQTNITNVIDRSIQVYAPCRDSKKTNVYETDIVKASEDPPPPRIKALKVPGFQEDDVSDPSTACSASSVESFPDQNRQILTSSEFLSKIRLTLRIMDSMIYSKKQLTFREGLDMDPFDPKAEITYSHERLFSFIDKRIALSEYVVTSMDWSSVNPNLLAIGYSRHPLYPEQDKGMICIWNIKMITKYERKFEFKNGVTYLEFCVPYPRLLNVALLDGSVLILDLGAKRNLVVTTKLSCVFSNYKPVWQFSWVELEKDHFIPITCGDNGFIHQLRPDGTFQHSKFLSLGHREGKVKGIKMNSSMGLKPRIRGRPGITCLAKHPTDPVLYLVGTTDGCVHICSIYFRNQHLDVFSAHIGAVKGIQFHPNCEHVFLTYGEDFYVRVWLYGTFEPALELMGGNFYVRAARWSPVNPEILISISNKYVDVWDIRRKTDTPIHRFMNPREIENTALIFDKTGRNIVLGNIGGDVYVYALKNMPFSHYFKGEAIAGALEKVLKAKKRFVRDIRKLGYPFGAQKEQPL